MLGLILTATLSNYCTLTIKLIEPVYVSGSRLLGYPEIEIPNVSLRDPFWIRDEAEPPRNQMSEFVTTAVDEGIPQFVLPVTIDDPSTWTALAGIVSVLLPVPAIGEVM